MLLSYKSYNRQQNHKYDGFILQTSSHLNQFFVLALSSDSSSPTWGTARCVGLTMVTIGGSGAPRIHLQWFFGVVFVICKIQDASYQITSSIFLCCIIIYIVYIYTYYNCPGAKHKFVLTFILLTRISSCTAELSRLCLNT